MFAVIKTGGKQYRVAANDQFTIERLPGEAGDTLTFTDVLMAGTAIGTPFVSGASVTAEIVEQTRGPKVISFKKRRRQNSKRSRGHRQDLTLIRIGEILTGGQQPTARAEPAATATAASITATEAASTTSAETLASDDTAATAADEAPKVKAAETAEAGVAADAVVEAAPKKPRGPRKKAAETDTAEG